MKTPITGHAVVLAKFVEQPYQTGLFISRTNLASNDSAGGNHCFDDIAFNEPIENFDRAATHKLAQHGADVGIKSVHVRVELCDFGDILRTLADVVGRNSIDPWLHRKANSVNKVAQLSIAFGIFNRMSRDLVIVCIFVGSQQKVVTVVPRLKRVGASAESSSHVWQDPDPERHPGEAS